MSFKILIFLFEQKRKKRGRTKAGLAGVDTAAGTGELPANYRTTGWYTGNTLSWPAQIPKLSLSDTNIKLALSEPLQSLHETHTHTLIH